MRIHCAINAEYNAVILLFCSWTLGVGRWALGVFLMLKRIPAVDFCQHGFHFWIARLVFGIPPIERAQRFIERIVGLFGFIDQAQSKLMHKPRLGSSIARRVNRFLTPLQKTLRVGERAFLFRMPRRWKKKNFGLDFFRL